MVAPRLSRLPPHNQSEDIPNLYFAGAGTHPGAGLLGVMSSGKIVADMIGYNAGVFGVHALLPHGAIL